MTKKIKLLLALTVLFPAISNAAEIFIDQEYGRSPYIRIEGAIAKGDLEKFKSVTKDFVLTSKFNELPVSINSVGGDIDEAIAIGRVARDLLASARVSGNIFRSFEGQWFYELRGKTLANDGSPFIRVPTGEAIEKEHVRGCYSACVLILYGAVNRLISDNFDQREGGIGQENKIIPTIGIHRPYYDKEYFKKLDPKEAKAAYAALEVKVRTYLTEMGAPQALIDRMFFKASNEVELIPAKEFRTLINDKEPYFDEWLISKCGSTTDGSTILSDKQYRRVQEFNGLRSKEIERRINSGGDYSLEFIQAYIPPGFTQEEKDSLYTPIQEHNIEVQKCKSSAVRNNLIKTVLSSSY